jgi:Protein of unknown function (DUF1822)
MNHKIMKNNIEHFTVELDHTTHQWAAKFAAQQTTPEKGRRVYLNTLAVCAVRQYLSCVAQLEIDLNLSDAWQPGLPSIMDIADLVIPHVGTIECRPVLSNIAEINLPPETIDDRLGYVAVQFSTDLSSVELIGFITNPVVANPQPSTYRINQLQPLDQLLDVIFGKRTTNLTQLLAGLLGTGWEAICNNTPSDLAMNKLVDDGQQIGLTNREFALRNVANTLGNSSYESICDFTAGKLITLQAQIENIPLLLLIGLSHEADGRVKVRTRIYAAGQEPLLPAHLQLTLKEENGQSLSQVQYPEAMNFIQLQAFRLVPGTRFDIQVTLDKSSFTESFVA